MASAHIFMHRCQYGEISPNTVRVRVRVGFIKAWVRVWLKDGSGQ